MKTVEVKNNVENKEAMNTITSVERLEQLVKGYAQDFPDTFGSNDYFLDGCKEILKWADKGSFFRCTVDELGYYGAKGQNHVSITFRGSKYSTFGPKDLFTVTIYEDKTMFFSTYDTYRKCTFDTYGVNKMIGAFMVNLLKFHEEFASKKEDMAEKFKAVANDVSKSVAGTGLTVSWYDEKNSKLMVGDKDNRPFCLFKADDISKEGKLVVVRKCCDAFNWDAVKESTKNMDDYDKFRFIDLFLYNRRDWDDWAEHMERCAC